MKQTIEEYARQVAKLHPTKDIDEEERYYNTHACCIYDGVNLGSSWQKEQLQPLVDNHAELLKALKDTTERMKRARGILNRKDGNSNWGMLNVSEYDSLIEKANQLKQ